MSKYFGTDGFRGEAGITLKADAYLLHVTTTPSVAYIARVDDFDCGIMISASHNPYYDKG